MEHVDKATRAQEWLMKYYRHWIPLDACLALVRHISAGTGQPEEPPIDHAAEEAYDNWARNDAPAEAAELRAEDAIEAEMADMMALALTNDLPPDLQEVCEFFI